MSRIRVCFLGTPEFAATSLKALLDDEHYEVVGVVTQPDRPSGRKLQLTPSPVKQLAMAHDLRVLSPENLRENKMINDAILTWGAEVAVVVAFGQILTEEFLQQFNFGCVNLHASLLPRWRGAAPIQRAIEAGDKTTGVCLQKMVRKLDAGDVLGARKLEIDAEMNSLELHDELAKLGADMLRVELMDYLRGNLGGVKQDESQVTYAKKLEKSESLMSFKMTAEAFHNKVRGFVWGPGTHVMFEGKRLKILKTRVAVGQSGPPGEVVEVGDSSFTVACAKGAIEILEVQPESRNRMPVSDFLRSSPLKVSFSF